MQEAIPYRTLFHHPLSSVSVLSSSSSSPNNTESEDHPTTTMVAKMVSENAVVVIGKRGCCMTHVVKRLLLALGVNPAVHELHGGEHEEQGIITLLQQPPFEVSDVQFPAVFIGGKLFGGLDRLMATHISGDLVPILKQAGALWL